MAFEKFEGAEFKDDVYEQLLADTYADTQGELGGLKNELSPYDVNSDGNYITGAFDEFKEKKGIPKYTETFRQDALT